MASPLFNSPHRKARLNTRFYAATSKNGNRRSGAVENSAILSDLASSRRPAFSPAGRGISRSTTAVRVKLHYYPIAHVARTLLSAAFDSDFDLDGAVVQERDGLVAPPSRRLFSGRPRPLPQPQDTQAPFTSLCPPTKLSFRPCFQTLSIARNDRSS